MASFYLSPMAVSDLENIFKFISLEKPRSAERFLSAASGTFNLLASHPEIGRARSLPPEKGVRSFAIRRFPSYLTFYRAQPNGVQILRIFHGARNLVGKL